MAVSVGEYWGQDPHTASHRITPLQPGGSMLIQCPFSGLPCRKLHNHDFAPEHPVCSVRLEESDGPSGLISVCPDRLLPAKTNGIWPPNIQVLSSIAETLFPGAYPGDIGYRRQITVQVGAGKQAVLDYVLDAPKFTSGKNRVILEVQGGGETSSTGSMTRHVAAWSLLKPPTNALLRQAVSKVGIIPNNAWKRQLEQITRKYPIAQRFDGVFALVTGELLLRYIRGLFPSDCSYFPEWEIALLGVAETPSTTPGPIRIDHVQEALFLTFVDFIAAVQDFPLPSVMPDPFAGTYTTMTNEDYQVAARPGSLGEAPALPMPEGQNEDGMEQ